MIEKCSPERPQYPYSMSWSVGVILLAECEGEDENCEMCTEYSELYTGLSRHIPVLSLG